GVNRYLEDVAQLAAAEERAGRFDAASTLFFRAGRALESELSDDARAARSFERCLEVASRAAAPNVGVLASAAVARQSLAAIRALDPIYARLGDNDARLRLLAKRVALESTEDDPKAAADAR